MLTKIGTGTRAVAAWARAMSAWVHGSGPLRLLARARRHPNALLAALLGIGILLMVLHWAGAPPGESRDGPALHAGAAGPRAAPPQSAHAGP